jgi:hypothetical protein
LPSSLGCEHYDVRLLLGGNPTIDNDDDFKVVSAQFEMLCPTLGMDRLFQLYRLNLLNS